MSPLFKRSAGKPLATKLLTTTTGQQKERQAEQYLCAQGLGLIERNYRCKMGEIDLIMQEGETLVFVEVRYRRSRHYGSASESVDHRKQQKLLRTAQHYLQQHYSRQRRPEPPCRFDVVALNGDNSGDNRHTGNETGKSPLEWIQNAFGL